MDPALPVMDGIEATYRLKDDSRTAHIPVVACTAFGHVDKAPGMHHAPFARGK
jgi:CheY-like chemotaxis protein